MSADPLGEVLRTGSREEQVAFLAGLSRHEYGNLRQIVAGGLEIHVDALDAQVRRHAEPAAVLDDTAAFLRRFVAYPSEAASEAHALWIAHTHAMERWDSTPRIAFLSPEPGSGKTRALEVTELLVPRPVEAINATPAYLFRKVNDPEGLPTILFDEIDTIFGPKAKKDNEEIRGVINAGHRKGAVAGRCVVRGKEIFTEELPAYCAVAMAGLGDLPDTILTRSVIIRMRRRAPNETIEPYRRRLMEPAGRVLHDRLAAFGRQILDAPSAYPDMPPGITDRSADVWEALLLIADMAGGRWPEVARVSAVTLVTDAMRDTPSLGVRLLADLRAIFGDREAMTTGEIVAALTAMVEAPWGELKGKPLNDRSLAHYLRRYQIAPKVVRVGAGTARGYTRESLHDAWQRYLPCCVPHIGSVTSVTSATGTTPGQEMIL